MEVQGIESHDAGGAFLRIFANISASDGNYPRSLALLAVRAARPDGASCGLTLTTGSVPGSPVLLDGHFFAGMEHPLSDHDLNRSSGKDLYARVTHLASMDWRNQSHAFSAAVGAYGEAIQARRVFHQYLSTVRPTSWQGPLVHYNSWYDFTSWQDQSFFDPQLTATVQQSLWLKQLLAELSQDQMNETAAIKKIHIFNDELGKRGVRIDSFLWDDGWDDPQRGMWAFNVDRFPDGFDNLARVADERNCFSPAFLRGLSQPHGSS